MPPRKPITRRSRGVSLPATTDVEKSPEARPLRRSSRVQSSTTSHPKRRSTQGSGKLTAPMKSLHENENESEPSQLVNEPIRVTNEDCMMDVGDESLQLATEPTTPTAPEKQRVLVSKDVALPHGKRLKRTVRIEHRKVPVPDDVMRKYKLDMSRWECRRLYKSIDTSLSATEQLDELVARIMLSDYYREGLTVVDESATSAAQYLSSEQAEPVLRPNPENKALKRKVAELNKCIREGRAELATWERFQLSVVEMEENPKVLREVRVEPIRVSGGDDAKMAFQGVLMKCSEADQSLNRMEMQMAVLQDKQEEFAKRFNRMVRMGQKHAKTPRKPAVFPGGGVAVADITPRAADS